MPQSTFSMALAKYLPTPESRRRFKRQCLKQKNILEQTSEIQIGCKVEKLYDFYTSKNYLQVNLFIGNKTKEVIKGYQIGFRGTGNLGIYLQEKTERIVKQNTQAKQRIIVEWLPQSSLNPSQEEYSHQILLTMSFSSPLLTLRDTPIPITVWSFCHFPFQPVNLPSVSYSELVGKIKHSYQLVEEQAFEVNEALFKKGLSVKQLEKYLEKLVKLQNTGSNFVFTGVFVGKSLLDEHFLAIQVEQKKEKITMKVTLAGNQYKYFQAIFAGLKFLLEK